MTTANLPVHADAVVEEKAKTTYRRTAKASPKSSLGKKSKQMVTQVKKTAVRVATAPVKLASAALSPSMGSISRKKHQKKQAENKIISEDPPVGSSSSSSSSSSSEEDDTIASSTTSSHNATTAPPKKSINRNYTSTTLTSPQRRARRLSMIQEETLAALTSSFRLYALLEQATILEKAINKEEKKSMSSKSKKIPRKLVSKMKTAAVNLASMPLNLANATISKKGPTKSTKASEPDSSMTTAHGDSSMTQSIAPSGDVQERLSTTSNHANLTSNSSACSFESELSPQSSGTKINRGSTNSGMTPNHFLLSAPITTRRGSSSSVASSTWSLNSHPSWRSVASTKMLFDTTMMGPGSSSSNSGCSNRSVFSQQPSLTSIPSLRSYYGDNGSVDSSSFSQYSLTSMPSLATINNIAPEQNSSNTAMIYSASNPIRTTNVDDSAGSGFTIRGSLYMRDLPITEDRYSGTYLDSLAPVAILYNTKSPDKQALRWNETTKSKKEDTSPGLVNRQVSDRKASPMNTKSNPWDYYANMGQDTVPNLARRRTSVELKLENVNAFLLQESAVAAAAEEDSCNNDAAPVMARRRSSVQDISIIPLEAVQGQGHTSDEGLVDKAPVLMRRQLSSLD